MKLKIKSNFSFTKLSSDMPRLMEKHLQRTATSYAEGAREMIKSGELEALKQSTIDRRKARGTGGTTPLFETGSLFRSLKGTSEGLEMNEYGIWHHKGTNRPERPFIFPSEKTILKSRDALKRDMNKALKK